MTALKPSIPVYASDPVTYRHATVVMLLSCQRVITSYVSLKSLGFIRLPSEYRKIKGILLTCATIIWK